MRCYTLDGEAIDFFNFLRTNNIGQGYYGASDPVYLALLNLKPGESYMVGSMTVTRKPYDGDLNADMERQLGLAYKDTLSESDKAELRVLTPKIYCYLNGET